MTIKGKLRLEKCIENMETGDEGFTLPWALSFEPVEDKVNAYLCVKYPISSKQEGTLQLHVKRTGPERDSFDVDLDSIRDYDYKYKFGKASYMGVSDEDIVCIGQMEMF